MIRVIKKPDGWELMGYSTAQCGLLGGRRAFADEFCLNFTKSDEPLGIHP